MQGIVSLRSVHGKFLSAQPDGRAEWNRDVALDWELFDVELRHGGKIALKGFHGMYVSAQPDGSVQINRRAAPPGGWEEFTVEARGNNVICLKSCHGKYLSAQQDGTAQWNRDHAPKGGWEDIQIEPHNGTGQGESAKMTSPMPPTVSVFSAGSPEVNGTYEFMPGKHENRHFSTIAGHYQHTQNPEIFIAFQDCGTNHQRPEWNKWMIISKIGVLYAAHTGGKIGVPPREGVWETVEAWGHPGAPGGAHPAPTVRHGDQASDAASRIQRHLNKSRTSTSVSEEPIQVLEAVPGKPVRFKLNNPPNHHEAWVGIYPTGASDQDHGAQNQRWKYIRDLDVKNAFLAEQPAGDWSIRVFMDGGYTIHERKDFTIHSAHGTRSTSAATGIQEHAPVGRLEPIEILEAVTGKPVRFKLNNPPNQHDAWVGIYPRNASDQDHGAENNRWKWLRNIDVNNASFPKRATGPWSIRVFSNGGHTLHERRDFDVKPPEPRDPAAAKSTRGSARIALIIGLFLLMPGVPLFVFGLGQGLSEGVTSASLEIEDVDGQGDLGWGIYIEGSLVDYNSNGIYDHCENIFVNASHSGSWMSDPWTWKQKINPPDESRQVFDDYCGHTDPVEHRHHDGRDLIKIGQACLGCMAGTTTITIQNQNGDEVWMWIQNEEKRETLGMLIPGAILMGVGAFTFVVALGTLLNMGFKSNASSSSKRSAVAAMGVSTLIAAGAGALFGVAGGFGTHDITLWLLIPSAIVMFIGGLVLFMSVAAVIRMGSKEENSFEVKLEGEENMQPRLEVLSFNHRQPIRFSITNAPLHNDAWVGLYQVNTEDRNHGDNWHYLRDIDVSNASFPGQEKGSWSLRVFTDGGYNIEQRIDFQIIESDKMEVWMQDAEYGNLRLKGLIADHRNNFTKRITTSKIEVQSKVGEINRFETDDTTYLVYDRDLEQALNEKSNFWDTASNNNGAQ